MKLLTEKEIEDVIHNHLTETADQAPTPEDRENLMEMFDLLKYIGTKSYSQAQQDLISQASEGFEEFIQDPERMNPLHEYNPLLSCWQASRLSMAKDFEVLKKENEGLKEEIKKLQHQLEIQTKRVENLSKGLKRAKQDVVFLEKFAVCPNPERYRCRCEYCEDRKHIHAESELNLCQTIDQELEKELENLK